jgi:hypothetical protein
MPPLDTTALIRQHQGKAPVQVGAIAHALGINVYSGRLPVGISGKLYRSPTEGGSSGWAILANNEEAKVRQRFTIAHEIGHFVLHLDLIGDSLEDDVFYRSKLSNFREAEANRFAADMLMPWNLIQDLSDKGHNTSAQSLARALDVSEVAMKIRLGLPT